MFAILYKLAENGHDRIHLKHGGRPYDTKEEAETYLTEFDQHYRPASSRILALVELSDAAVIPAGSDPNWKD
jgi:hypothetical protein